MPGHLLWVVGGVGLRHLGTYQGLPAGVCCRALGPAGGRWRGCAKEHGDPPWVIGSGVHGRGGGRPQSATPRGTLGTSAHPCQ